MHAQHMLIEAPQFPLLHRQSSHTSYNPEFIPFHFPKLPFALPSMLLWKHVIMPLPNGWLHHLWQHMPRNSFTELTSSCCLRRRLSSPSKDFPYHLFIRQVHGGFAFIYFEDERDADDAVRHLDNAPFGYSRRRLSVEWARGDRGPRFRDGDRGGSEMRPTRTLFVIHFDPVRTRTSDIERHFEPYGKIMNVRIRRNFAFVQFATQEEATRALEATNMSKILDRVVSVEYVLRDDGEPDRRESPRGGYGRRRSPYGRSMSPVPRSRPSPDYGRGRSLLTMVTMDLHTTGRIVPTTVAAEVVRP